MRACIVSVQSAKEGFVRDDPENPIPISFVGIVDFDLENLPSSPRHRFYPEENIDHALSLIRECDVAVCYQLDYTLDMLKQYDSDINRETRFFDIHGYIEGELEKRVKMDTVARAFDMHRTVTSGLACVSFFKKGQISKLLQCIRRDLDILLKCTRHILTQDELVLEYDSKEQVLDISMWKDVIKDYAKPKMTKTDIQQVLEELDRIDPLEVPQMPKKTYRVFNRAQAFKHVHDYGGRIVKKKRGFDVLDKHDQKIGIGTEKVENDFQVSFVQNDLNV